MIDSPCTRVCCLDDNDVCVGCFRSMKEIMAWGGASDDERREILRQCEARREERRAVRAKPES